MADPAGIPAPNYTQIPNAIFELMADKDAHLTESELRVILAIARKTFGWHKKRDKISLTQLEKLTAMSRPSIVAGLEAAIDRGIVRRTPDKNDKLGGFFYELAVDEPNDQTSKKSELVKEVNQLKDLTETSKESLPELVKNFNPQKKEKEKKERGGDAAVNEKPSRGSSPPPFFEKLAEVCKINLQMAPPNQRSQLGEAAAKLSSAGATVEQLDAFSVWWWSDDNWRTKKARKDGRKPEAPRPREVQEEWGNAVLPAANGHKPTGRGPPGPVVPAIPADAHSTDTAAKKLVELMREQRERQKPTGQH